MFGIEPLFVDKFRSPSLDIQEGTSKYYEGP